MREQRVPWKAGINTELCQLQSQAATNQPVMLVLQTQRAESDISLDASMPGPYSFEPSASDTSSCDTTAESASSSDGDEDTSRITDMSW